MVDDKDAGYEEHDEGLDEEEGVYDYVDGDAADVRLWTASTFIEGEWSATLNSPKWAIALGYIYGAGATSNAVIGGKRRKARVHAHLLADGVELTPEQLAEHLKAFEDLMRTMGPMAGKGFAVHIPEDENAQ